ncbi:MAG: trypsin-like peptidase domain-containing protein, partial [Chloroflexota bacterium]
EQVTRGKHRYLGGKAMKNWLVILIAIILAAGIGTNGYFNYKDTQRLDGAEAQIVSLEADVSQLTGDLSALSGELSQLAAVASGLERDISQVASDLDNVESSLKGQISQVSADLRAHGSAVTDAVAKVEPWVVRIDVSDAGLIRSGSGFLVTSDGYVLTSQHVVDVGSPIQITLASGEKYFANVAASSRSRDLALLRLNSPRTDFPAAVLGSSGAVKVGEEILAAGFPLGIQLAGRATFSRGIVSAVRVVNGLNFIQCDAAINPGNSGGCLANLQGQVIGVVTAGVVSASGDLDGLTLAIPIDEAKTFIQSTLGR